VQHAQNSEMPQKLICAANWHPAVSDGQAAPFRAAWPGSAAAVNLTRTAVRTRMPGLFLHTSNDGGWCERREGNSPADPIRPDGRRRGQVARVICDLLHQVVIRVVELNVVTRNEAVRVQVQLDVGIDAMAFSPQAGGRKCLAALGGRRGVVTIQEYFLPEYGNRLQP
jgi:hypothetical protein